MRKVWRWVRSDLTLAFAIATLIALVAIDISHANGYGVYHLPGFGHAEDWMQTREIEVRSSVSINGTRFTRYGEIGIHERSFYAWPDIARIPLYMLSGPTHTGYLHDVIGPFELFVVYTGQVGRRFEADDLTFRSESVIAHFSQAELDAFYAADWVKPVPALEIHAPDHLPVENCPADRTCSGQVRLYWTAPIDREMVEEEWPFMTEAERREELIRGADEGYDNSPVGPPRVALLSYSSVAEHRVLLGLEIAVGTAVLALVGIRFSGRDREPAAQGTSAEGLLRAVDQIEGYLRRLRTAYVLVGMLMLIGGGMLIVILEEARGDVGYWPSQPYGAWPTVTTLLLWGTSAVGVSLWARAFYQVHRDLKEWRAASATMPLR